MKLAPETIDVSIEELERLVEQTGIRTLEDGERRKLAAALETLGQMGWMLADQDATVRQLKQMLLKPATTEKTRQVLDRAGIQPKTESAPAEKTAEEKKRKGHGRNPASAFEGAPKVEVKHPTLRSGDRCPECLKGRCTR